MKRASCAEVSRETFVINMMLLSPGGGTVERYLLITNNDKANQTARKST